MVRQCHYILPYFGTRYAPMLGALLESIWQCSPQRHVVFLHYDTPDAVTQIARSYANVLVIPAKKPTYDRSLACAVKPLIVASYLQDTAMQGCAFMIDVDMIVRRDPFGLFEDEDDLLFTTRPGPWPINGGILGMKDPENPKTSEFFNAWAQRIAEISSSPRLVRIARSRAHPYGHVDQMAFSDLILYDSGRTVFRSEPRGLLRLRAIDGGVLNETRSIPIQKDANILHYKGGWHAILLEGRCFTSARPMGAGWDMFVLYGVFHTQSWDRCSEAARTALGRLPGWYDARTQSIRWGRYAVRKCFDVLASAMQQASMALSGLFRLLRVHVIQRKRR